MTKKTKAPLPYASLGVRGKSIGGIADESGVFSINLTNAKPNDEMVISYIGYQAVTFKVEKFALEKYQEIYLEPKATELREVVVFDKKEIIVLGNNRKGYRSTGWVRMKAQREDQEGQELKIVSALNSHGSQFM